MTMQDYTNYCTPEQTVRAYDWGAPIEISEGLCEWTQHSTMIIEHNEPIFVRIPTTQQMIGWLEAEHKISIDVSSFRKDGYKVCIDLEWEDVDEMNCQYFETRKDAELAAIDFSLGYLEKMKGE